MQNRLRLSDVVQMNTILVDLSDSGLGWLKKDRGNERVWISYDTNLVTIQTYVDGTWIIQDQYIAE